MKTFITILSGFMLAQLNCVFSQNFYIIDPKGTKYVPMGSYMAKKNNTDTATSLISVQAFFITNEITNKEYREFTDYAKSHPNDSLQWIEFGEQKKITVMGRTYKELIKSLIDSSAMAKECPVNSEMHNKYKNYFTDKNFNNYPVVGVSYNAARYYCVWKTTEENAIRKKKGVSIINDFRLPQKEELDYASYITTNSEENDTKGEVQEVKSGKLNQWGIYYLSGNVSEWTSSSYLQDKTKKITRGDSWRTNYKSGEDHFMDAQSSSGQIGFRIVSTPLSIKKY